MNRRPGESEQPGSQDIRAEMGDMWSSPPQRLLPLRQWFGSKHKRVPDLVRAVWFIGMTRAKIVRTGSRTVSV